MTLGKLLYVVAAVILFLGGIGSPAVPNPVIWALFCMVLGLILDSYPLRRFW